MYACLLSNAHINTHTHTHIHIQASLAAMHISTHTHIHTQASLAAALGVYGNDIYMYACMAANNNIHTLHSYRLLSLELSACMATTGLQQIAIVHGT